MSFTRFKSRDLVDPDLMTDNFYHVGQDNLYPKSGISMTNDTSNVYNLGSIDYKWKNCFVNTIKYNDEIKDNLNIINYGYTSAATATWDISGLNSDNTNVFILHGFIGAVSETSITTVRFVFNNDSTTSSSLTTTHYITYNSQSFGQDRYYQFFPLLFSGTLSSSRVMFKLRINKAVSGYTSYIVNTTRAIGANETITAIQLPITHNMGTYQVDATITSIKIIGTNASFYITEFEQR